MPLLPVLPVQTRFRPPPRPAMPSPLADFARRLLGGARLAALALLALAPGRGAADQPLPLPPPDDPRAAPPVHEFDPAAQLDPDAWDWQALPGSLIYSSYLAGVKEPRFASVWNYDRASGGWFWDIAMGGRVGLVRYGSLSDERPEGWQLDMEGAAFPRLDLEDEEDLLAADFRFGLPLSYGLGPLKSKLAFYHLSSHLGDEFLENHPSLSRINYSRNVLVWGESLYCSDATRVYAEAGWAFDSDVSEPWEFQFGVDYSPLDHAGRASAPFAAVNGHLRQEVDFGGNLVLQAGWQWRQGSKGRVFRVGAQYFDGKNEQFEFFDRREQKIGLGMWYDF